MCFELVDLVKKYNKQDFRCSEIPILRWFARRAEKINDVYFVKGLSQSFISQKCRVSLKTVERVTKRLVQQKAISIHKKGNGLTHDVTIYIFHPERFEHFEEIELTHQDSDINIFYEKSLETYNEIPPDISEKINPIESIIEITVCDLLPTKLSPESVDNIHTPPDKMSGYVYNIINNKTYISQYKPSTELRDLKKPESFEVEILKLENDAEAKIAKSKLTSDQLKWLYEHCEKIVEFNFEKLFRTLVIRKSLKQNISGASAMSANKSTQQSDKELIEMRKYDKRMSANHSNIKPKAIFNLTEMRKSIECGKTKVDSQKRATG